MQVIENKYKPTILYDIGEQFEQDGITLKCVDGTSKLYKWNNCEYCYFNNKSCIHLCCSALSSPDGITRLFIDPNNPMKKYLALDDIDLL